MGRMRREPIVFLGLNLLVPVALRYSLFAAVPADWRTAMVVTAFLVLQGANVARAAAVPSWRIAYGVILVLNTVALVMLGSVSFLPSLPGLYGFLSRTL